MFNLIRYLFDQLVFKSPNSISLFLINLRSILHNKKNIFFFDKKISKFYLLINSNQKFYILEKKRLNFYVKGFDERIKILNNDYMLNEINFEFADNIIDCGANIGEFRYCFDNTINYFAFEPSINEFQILEFNLKNEKKLNNFGLWSKSDKINFYIKSETADSSFELINNYQSIQKVKVRRLDEVISSDIKIKLLKLEAEGSEYEVIKGAEKILNNIKYISADLGYEKGLNQESSFNEVSSYLKKKGFKIIKSNYKRMVFLFLNTIKK